MCVFARLNPTISISVHLVGLVGLLGLLGKQFDVIQRNMINKENGTGNNWSLVTNEDNNLTALINFWICQTNSTTIKQNPLPEVSFCNCTPFGVGHIYIQFRFVLLEIATVVEFVFFHIRLFVYVYVLYVCEYLDAKPATHNH